ncbi:MAG: DNA ligase, partial [Candidatus Altiarchaeales archaeon]|nr:DNA ligase [Candidatus Altiarchaeales archaeon]
MKFSRLTDLFERLEGISGRIEMTDLVCGFLGETDDESLENVIFFLRGRVFPLYDERDLGVAEKLMVKALSEVSGAKPSEIHGLLRERGDMGLAAQKVLVSKPQTTLVRDDLTVARVGENLRRIAVIEGKGTVGKKLGYVKELLSQSSGVEGRYLVRLILGQLRLGVGDGILRDAIAKAFDVEAAEVERAYNLRCDMG